MEDVTDVLLSVMQSRLPALLELEWAAQLADDVARGEEVPIVYPALFLYGYRAEGPQEFPAIMAWAEESDYETNYVASSGGKGASEVQHIIYVAVLLVSDDDATIERQLSRYRRALWRLFAENQTIPNSSVMALVPRKVARESEATGRLAAIGARGIIWTLEASTYEEF